MRKRFAEQLEEIKDELIEMGQVVEASIEKALDVLLKQDASLAEGVAKDEADVDAYEMQIESKGLRVILFEQPVARDLRAITTALKIITDLERIADQSLDITEIALRFIGKPLVKKPEHIISMAENCRIMVKQSIDSFVRQDLALAKSVIEQDDEVDSLFLTVRDEVVHLIRDHADNGEQAIDFMMIAKYFERIADHCVNVAEWVIFNITGMHKDERIL